MTVTTGPRPCERQCKRCRLWKHHSRFKKKAGHSSEARFDSVCKDCQQKERNERKNENRPLAIIRQRCARDATKASKSTEFFWVNMGYRTLVADFRAKMSPEGLCNGCGHPFLNERDIQLEHREPPRHAQDWARLHAENISLACAACNRMKGHKTYVQWLDDRESARLSNEADPSVFTDDPKTGTLSLFDPDA